MTVGMTSVSATFDQASRSGTAPVARWQPAGASDAVATLDRISRYCEFSCAADTTECIEDRCEAWQLESAAAVYLAGRSLDEQD